MEITTKKQALLKAISAQLEPAYEDTLEDVLELLDSRKIELSIKYKMMFY